MTTAEHFGQAVMDSVETYLADITAAIRPLLPREIALVDALGAVLAADVTAQWPLPSFDNSAMDGYAVRAADVAGATDQAARDPPRRRRSCGRRHRAPRPCSRHLHQDHDRRTAARGRGRGRSGRAD